MWRPEIRQGTDKYAATETLYVLQNLIKQLEIKKKKKKKKKSKTEDTLVWGDHRKSN